MHEWKIKSRARVCHACQRPFTDRHVYHTLLFSERDEYLRLDVCASCWRDQYGQGANNRKGFVSHWRGLFSEPPAPPPEAIEKETAESLLRKIVQRDDPAFRAPVYILAVMLERKRLLKVRDQVRDARGRVFVYEHAKTGDLFTIRDPELRMGELGRVQKDVARLLLEGLSEDAKERHEPAVCASDATAETPAGEWGGAASPPATDRL